MELWGKNYKAFKKQYFEHSNRYAELVKNGQKPKSLVISCCDSRVDPCTLLQAKPGEIFVVRNIANLIPPASMLEKNQTVMSAIEFGLLFLHIKHLMIIGHRFCGGVSHLVNCTEDKAQTSYFIDYWLSVAAEVRDLVEQKKTFASADEKLKFSEQMSILLSYKNLLTYSWVKALVDSGQLKIDLCYFDLSSGDLSEYVFAEKKFIKL